MAKIKYQILFLERILKPDIEPSHGRSRLGPGKDQDLDQELDNNSIIGYDFILSSFIQKKLYLNYSDLRLMLESGDC